MILELSDGVIMLTADQHAKSLKIDPVISTPFLPFGTFGDAGTTLFFAVVRDACVVSRPLEAISRSS